MILRRDIYDRDMIYSWGNGRVTLLGDAAHPMQPNFGQGGCMAIEVSYLWMDDILSSYLDILRSMWITLVICFSWQQSNFITTISEMDNFRILRNEYSHEILFLCSILLLYIHLSITMSCQMQWKLSGMATGYFGHWYSENADRLQMRFITNGCLRLVIKISSKFL